MKDIKLFLKKKNKNREHDKNLTEEQKQRQVEHMRNYYLAHKKQLFGHFFSFVKDPRAIKFISWISP